MGLKEQNMNGSIMWKEWISTGSSSWTETVVEEKGEM